MVVVVIAVREVGCCVVADLVGLPDGASACVLMRQFQTCRLAHLYDLIPEANPQSDSYTVSFALLTKLGNHIVTQTQVPPVSSRWRDAGCFWLLITWLCVSVCIPYLRQEDIRYLLTTFKNVASLPALLGALYIDAYGRYASKLLEKGQVPT